MLNSKWQKLIIGAVLLVGFVGYFQYKKTADPDWKVDKENFQVVNSWNELMKMEESKNQDLRFVNHFNLLKDSNIVIPIPNEQRELRIEKTWDYSNQMYVLYSLDLLERDTNMSDLPELYVDEIKLSNNDGDSFVTAADNFNGESSSNGYVYKHRLYRSVIVSSNFETVYTESDWKKIMSSNRIEFTKFSLSSKNGTIKLNPISFTITPAKINDKPKPIATTEVKTKLNLYNGQQIAIKNLEFYQIGSRLTLEETIDPHLISLIGLKQIGDKEYPAEFQITQNNGNFYIETSTSSNDLVSEENNNTKLLITHSIHKTNRSHDFFVSKEDIKKIIDNPSQDIVKSKVIFNEHGVMATFQGLTLDEQTKKPVIKFTMATPEFKEFDNMVYPRESYRFKEVSMDENFNTNLVTINNQNGKIYENFDIQSTSNQERAFLIYFNNGLPKENLTIRLSNLTGIEPLKKVVEIPLKVPR
jgi:hypothetical protein